MHDTTFQILRLACLSTLLALLTVQCVAPTTSKTAEVAAPATEVVALARELHYVPSDLRTLSQAEEALIRRFEEAYPDLKIDKRYPRSIGQTLTTSPPPDVVAIGFFAGSDPFRSFIDQGRILDISDLWAQQGWNESYPQQLQEVGIADGKHYFLPLFMGWGAIYYNRPIFERYSLMPPETWDEFLSVCETLKQNAITPIAFDNRGQISAILWFQYLNIRLNGPEFHIGLVLGDERFDDPRIGQVFEIWKVLLDHDYIDDAQSYDFSRALQRMGQGEAAMYLTGSIAISLYLPKQYYPEDELGFFRFPVINPEVPTGEIDWGSLGYLIPAGAPNPEVAMEFLTHAGSFEAQTYIVEAGLTDATGVVPIHNDVDPSNLTPEARQGLEVLKSAEFIVPFSSSSELEAVLIKFIRHPDDVDAILAELERERQ